jgi:hypothetical protein
MAKVKRLAGPVVRTVKIKLLKGVVLGPGDDGNPGDIYEVPRHVATPLVFQGLAEYTTEGDPLKHDETPASEKDAFPTTNIEAPTSRDPRPARRG